MLKLHTDEPEKENLDTKTDPSHVLLISEHTLMS